LGNSFNGPGYRHTTRGVIARPRKLGSPWIEGHFHQGRPTRGEKKRGEKRSLSKERRMRHRTSEWEGTNPEYEKREKAGVHLL